VWQQQCQEFNKLLIKSGKFSSESFAFLSLFNKAGMSELCNVGHKSSHDIHCSLLSLHASGY
jgi:hypothetical protein